MKRVHTEAPQISKRKTKVKLFVFEQNLFLIFV